MENGISSTQGRINQNRALGFEDWLGESDGNAEIGTAKTPDDGECHADHLAIAIDERTPGATGSRLRIVDNLVRENVADVALGNERANELTAKKLVGYFSRISAGGLGDVVDGVLAGAGENRADPGCVTHGEQSLPAHRSFPT